MIAVLVLIGVGLAALMAVLIVVDVLGDAIADFIAALSNGVRGWL